MTKSISRCAALKCINNSQNSIYSFFRFPMEINRARAWMVACQREDLSDRLEELHKSSHRVCGLHFEPKMFLNDLRNRLHKQAVPTIFPLLQSSSEVVEISPKLEDANESPSNLLSNDEIKIEASELQIKEETTRVSENDESGVKCQEGSSLDFSQQFEAFINSNSDGDASQETSKNNILHNMLTFLDTKFAITDPEKEKHGILLSSHGQIDSIEEAIPSTAIKKKPLSSDSEDNSMEFDEFSRDEAISQNSLSYDPKESINMELSGNLEEKAISTADRQTQTGRVTGLPVIEKLKDKVQQLKKENSALRHKIKKLEKLCNSDNYLQRVTLEDYKKLTIKFCSLKDLVNCVTATYPK